MRTKKLVKAAEYAFVLIFSAIGVVLASGLEIHTDGTIVKAGSNTLAAIPLTVTLDGRPVGPGVNASASVNLIASVVGRPFDQCGVWLVGPASSNTLVEPGLYALYAGVQACNVGVNQSAGWKTGKTSIRIRATSFLNNVVSQAETVTGIDAQ